MTAATSEARFGKVRPEFDKNVQYISKCLNAVNAGGAVGVVSSRDEKGLYGGSLSSRFTTRSATAGRAGTSHRKVLVAAAAPSSWATTNPGTSTGRMPAKV